MEFILDKLTPVVVDQILLLAISGVAGAYLRAVIWPEPRWAKRLGQVLAGAFSAMFLGGWFAHIFEALVAAGNYSYLAAGFIMGSAGEVGVKFVQDKVLGKRNGTNSSSK